MSVYKDPKDEKDFIRLSELKTKSTRWFFANLVCFVIFISICFFFKKIFSQDIKFIILGVCFFVFVVYKFYDFKYENLKRSLSWKKMNEAYEQFFNDLKNQLNMTVDKVTNSYKLFQLTPSDSEKTIKERYKELAQKWHPDKWVTDTLENQKIAEGNFKKLVNAYETIKKHKGIK
jgi:hypothetical protein